MVPFLFMWGHRDNWFCPRVDVSENYTFTPSLILLTRNTQNHANLRCLHPRRSRTALWRKLSLSEAYRGKKKKEGIKILYHVPQLVSPELVKNWRPSLPYWKSYSQPLQKQWIRSWCFQNRATHCHSYRGKLCLVILTRSPQYWPQLWFSQSALVCLSQRACFWTQVINHRCLTP